MRKLLTLILLLCCLDLSAQTYVQSKSSGQGATPQTVTPTGAVTAGNTLVAVILSAGIAGGGAVTVTGDNNSNTWACGATITDATNTNFRTAVCCIHAPTLTPNNPPTVTAADSGGSNHLLVNVREYSGLTCTADGQSASTSSSTTSLTTTNLVTTATDLLLEGFVDTGSHNISAGTGWVHADIDNSNDHYLIAEKVNQASGTYAGAATLTSADATWGGIIAGYKVTSSAVVRHRASVIQQ